MAGRGPAPKQASERRNRNQKLRGEYITLSFPVGKPPPLPVRGKGRGVWSARTRRAWKAWWSDPASTQWSVSDCDLVEHLADLHERNVREPRNSTAAEIRQVRDSLGLTPKGRQDRRWNLPTVAEVADIEAERKAKLRRDSVKEMNKRAAAAEGAS